MRYAPTDGIKYRFVVHPVIVSYVWYFVCDGRTEHHLSLQHVEIVVNGLVSTESLISMKVDLGNNYT